MKALKEAPVRESEKYPLTPETRKKLKAAADALMEIWDGLGRPDPTGQYGRDEDSYGYRGGLVSLTVKGGYTQGWVDLDWNSVVRDIYVGLTKRSSRPSKRKTRSTTGGLL